MTLNTDNRLMSRTTLTDEYMVAVESVRLRPSTTSRRISINGMKSAFAHYDERCRLIFDRVKAPFAALRAELGA